MLLSFCIDCLISGLEKYKVLPVPARSFCVMILDIEIMVIECEMPQL